MFFLLGLMVHLTAASLPSFFPMILKSLYLSKKFKITNQNFYDYLTTIGALICVLGVLNNPLTLIKINSFVNYTIIGSLIALFLGVLLPISIWLLNNTEKIKKENKIFVRDNLLLFLTASSEEVIWRLCVPLVLFSLLNTPIYISFVIGGVGFIIIHWPKSGMKSTYYLSLFTVVVINLSFFFGLSAAIIFHATHNLFLKIFKPFKKKNSSENTKIIETNEDW